MHEALKKKLILLTWILGILLTSMYSMPLVNAQSSGTRLTIAVPSPPLGLPFWSEGTLEATLTDGGNPLPNMTVDFYGCLPDCDWRIGTAKTNSNGVASLLYAFPTAETYQVHAMFNGTTNYASSSSDSVEIVIIDYSSYIYGGLFTVAIGAIAYNFYRRRN